ncbi:EamA/RhaT family transporter [Moritella marina]|uniref:EamA family transporter n=1 Tax=Moritella marina TaxID=90736 RepID=UPI003704C6DB
MQNTLNQLSPRVKGISLALISTALFVFVGVLVRILNESIDVFQILFFRQLVFILLLLPAIVKNSELLRQPTCIKLHLFRILGAFFALYCGFLTLSNIPFADATALGFTQVLFVGLISLMPSLMSWQWPNGETLLLLILVGVISSIAQWIGISAYKLAEANVIANVEYAKIIYSLLFGYWLFAEQPNTMALCGVVIILLSAVIPLWVNRRAKQKQERGLC